MRARYLLLLLLPVLLATAYWSSSRITIPFAAVSEHADTFFVCQECGCLSALVAAEPAAEIPAHTAVCPKHDWLRLSRDEYVRKASKSPLEMSLIPPMSEWAVPTSKGDLGMKVYRQGFVLYLGSTGYVVSRHSFIWFALATFCGGALVACGWAWTKVSRRSSTTGSRQGRDHVSLNDRTHLPRPA